LTVKEENRGAVFYNHSSFFTFHFTGVNMTNILWAVFWMTIFGVGVGLILAVAGKKLYVKSDCRIEAIAEMLPKVNCGGCGRVGCAELAKDIAEGAAAVDACPVGGNELARAVAEVMGVPLDRKTVHYRAQVMCSGTNDFARRKFKYAGIKDCVAANRLSGGDKVCPNGCLGFNTCADSCPFDAIHIINGVAAVDYHKCTACGVCVIACPKQIIKLIPYEATHWVGCISTDRGATVRKYCDVGCIACNLCVKKCPEDAITVDDNFAVINHEKCSSCGECEKVCPQRVIWSGGRQLTVDS